MPVGVVVVVVPIAVVPPFVECPVVGSVIKLKLLGRELVNLAQKRTVEK